MGGIHEKMRRVVDRFFAPNLSLPGFFFREFSSSGLSFVEGCAVIGRALPAPLERSRSAPAPPACFHRFDPALSPPVAKIGPTGCGCRSPVVLLPMQANG